MASEGAADESSYKYEITPQKAVVSRSIGDLYTFNYPETCNSNSEIYDFATGGDGMVAIGATDSFESVSEKATNNSAFTAAPFTGSTTGNFAWPLPSKINVREPGFLNSETAKIFKSRSYGHSYNMGLGLNFDLGTDDGNEINLATNWSYSDFFRGDSANRYATAAPTSGKSGWEIQPTFDMSCLTESFPISDIDEKAAAWFVNIKNLFTTMTKPAVWLTSIVQLCRDYPVPANASASFTEKGWTSLSFAAPAGLTTANFKDYSEVKEKSELLSEFGLDVNNLCTERSLGTTASYIKGDSHSIWENATGTSSVETKFPAPDSDGGWGYWERSKFDNIKSYSQTGTIKATTSSITKVSSDVIKKEITSSAHAISFGYTLVPALSFGINLKGVKTVFGHTPPTTVDIDCGFSRVEMTAALNKNKLTLSSVINGSKLTGEDTKTEVTFNKKVIYIGPVRNILAGGVHLKSGATGGKVDAGATDLKSSLLKSFYNLQKVKAIGAKLQANGARLSAQTEAYAEGVTLNPGQGGPESGPTQTNAEDNVERTSVDETTETNNRPSMSGSSEDPNITDGASPTAQVTTPVAKKKVVKKKKKATGEGAYKKGGKFGKNIAAGVKAGKGFFGEP